MIPSSTAKCAAATSDEFAPNILLGNSTDQKIQNEITPQVISNSAIQEPQKADFICKALSAKEKIQNEFDRLGRMLEDPNCDRAHVLQQALAIVKLLSNHISQIEKLHSLDKEEEIRKFVGELKASYKTVGMLVFTVICGITKTASGFGLLGAEVFGSAAGDWLSDLTDVLSFFGDDANKEIVRNLSGGIGSVSDGVGQFKAIPEAGTRSEQIVLENLIEYLKKLQNNSHDAHKGARDQGHSALSQCRSIAETAHSTFVLMIKGQST